MSTALSQLRRLKIVHTVVWAFFVATICAIPILGWVGQYRLAALCAAIVFLEVIVLAMNGWRCPLTAIAGRYTQERGDNFDIYLPAWLARHNKVIFGSLYLFGVLLTLARWRGWVPH